MKNKRTLKKNIDIICAELLAECVGVTLYDRSNINKENAESLIKSIIKLGGEFRRRANHAEPGMKAKVYYKKINDDFTKQASAILDQITNLN